MNRIDLWGDTGGERAAAGVQDGSDVVLDQINGNGEGKNYVHEKDSSVCRGWTSLINLSSTLGV